MKRRRLPTKVIVMKRITIFLFFYIMFLTLYFTSTSLAKYIGTINGNGNVGVAKWYVEGTSNTNSISLVAGNDTQSCKVIVLSTSEVSSKYSIVLTNVPDGLQVSIDNGTTFKTAANNRIEFNNSGSFYTNESVSNEHTLIFQAPLSMNEVTNQQINIDVIFVQDQL